MRQRPIQVDILSAELGIAAAEDNLVAKVVVVVNGGQRETSGQQVLFNPGLVSAWFAVTGVFGILLILNGAITASTVMLKEREFGTIEQLLMSPAG